MKLVFLTGIVIILSLSACGVQCDSDRSDFELSENIASWYSPIVNEVKAFLHDSINVIRLDFSKSEYTVFCGDECPECKAVEFSFDYKDDMYRVISDTRDIISLTLNDTTIVDHNMEMNTSLSGSTDFQGSSTILDSLQTELLRFEISRASGLNLDLFTEILLSKSDGLIGFTVNGDSYSRQ